MNAIAKIDAHLWARHPEDWYIEPEWCSERLFEQIRFMGPILDPACGSGRIVRAARRAGYQAFGSDIVKRSDECLLTCDWLKDVSFDDTNVVSNPPFGIAQQFASIALQRASGAVALLLPSKWLHGNKRSIWLETTPLHSVWILTPRPSMPPGPVIEAGLNPGGGKEDFAWFVWRKDIPVGKPEIRWLRRDG